MILENYLKYLFEGNLSKSKCPHGYVWNPLRDKCVKDPGGYYNVPHLFFRGSPKEEDPEDKKKEKNGKKTSPTPNNQTNGSQTQNPVSKTH